MLALLIASAAVLAAPSSSAAAAAEPSASTAPARSPRPPRPPENPWTLTYGLDRRGDRYGRVDYRLRWSLRDFSGPGRAPDSGSGAVFEENVRGLMQGMGVEVYGVRLRPFRDLHLHVPRPAAVSTAAASSPDAAPRAARRRPVYSWERLYEDLESSARRETERFIVREGFDRALPAHRSAPYDQKKALGSGLLDLGMGALAPSP